MKAHERLWKALNHEEADRVPTFAQHLEDPFLKNWDAKLGRIPRILQTWKRQRSMIKNELGVALELGLDSKWNHSGKYIKNKRDRPNIPKEISDKFSRFIISAEGHVYEKHDGGTWYQDGILKTPELIKDWISYVKTFEPAPSSHWKHIKHIWDTGCAKDMVPIPTAGGPTYTTWGSIGIDRLAYIGRKSPQLIKDLHSAWTDVAIEMHKCLFEEGIDLVFFCDDHCYKDRCIFSVEQFDAYFTENFTRMANNAHKYGAKILLHSDGNLTQEIPSLIKAGIDAAEPLEYEANNHLGTLKEKFGDRITLIGNVAASDTLSYGSVEDTIKMTKQCILDAAVGGGYILAPGSDVLGTIKIENIKAMIATVKKYGTYPLNKANLT